MTVKLFDSRTRRKVDVEPLVPGKLGIYVCGPTPYAPAHIGHARSNIAFDVVRRYLVWRGFEVKFVRNVTDVEDKIIKAAHVTGEPPLVLAARFTAEYDKDMAAVGSQAPDVVPLVSEHIPEIVALTEALILAGKAYAVNGDVYYAVTKFAPYGALSGQSVDELQAGARVDVNEQKENPLDFALWKAAKPGEPSWPSPWGPGRPGWHIECSAMCKKHLGDTFDIHGGGKDLIFPHHENEIAQSQGVTGEGTFARLWMHNGFVNFSGEKMSKSLGNVFNVADLVTRYDGEAVRFFMVQHHYRAPINFEVVKRDDDSGVDFPGLDEAEKRLAYFYSTLSRADDFLGAATPDTGALAPGAEGLADRVRAAMDDDLNTSVVVAELGETAKLMNKLLEDPKAVAKDVRKRTLATLARDLREVAGGALGLLARPPREMLHARRSRLCARRGLDPARVEQLLADRAAARAAKDFTRADAIREELRTLAVEVMDTPRGVDWSVSE